MLRVSLRLAAALLLVGVVAHLALNFFPHVLRRVNPVYAAAAIERGEADVMIAGGSDSTSNAEIKLPQKVVHAMAPLAFGKATPGDVLGVIAQLAPFTDIFPQRPKIAERRASPPSHFDGVTTVRPSRPP